MKKGSAIALGLGVSLTIVAVTGGAVFWRIRSLKGDEPKKAEVSEQKKNEQQEEFDEKSDAKPGGKATTGLTEDTDEYSDSSKDQNRVKEDEDVSTDVDTIDTEVSRSDMADVRALLDDYMVRFNELDYRNVNLDNYNDIVVPNSPQRDLLVEYLDYMHEFGYSEKTDLTGYSINSASYEFGDILLDIELYYYSPTYDYYVTQFADMTITNDGGSWKIFETYVRDLY